MTWLETPGADTLPAELIKLGNRFASGTSLGLLVLPRVGGALIVDNYKLILQF